MQTRLPSLRAAALLLAIGALLAACGDDSHIDTGGTTTAPTTTTTAPATTLPARPADISGTVTSVSPFVPVTEDCTPAEDLDPDGAVSSDDPPVCTPEDNDVVGTILVEEQPGVQDGRKISFTVTTSTVLAGTTGAPLSGFDDLATGQTVRGWATGPCAESYPEQCGAAAIERTT